MAKYSKTLVAQIAPETYEELELIADKHFISVGAVVRQALSEHIIQNGVKS